MRGLDNRLLGEEEDFAVRFAHDELLLFFSDKFVGNEFGQPKAGPKGGVHGWTEHKK